MWNQKQFEEIYARYQSSGLQIKDFCRNECIATSKFFYWQRKLRKQQVQPGETAGFVPIIFTPHEPQYQGNIHPRQPAVTRTPPTGDAYGIIYPGGVILRVPPGTDLVQLRSLILLTGQGHV